MAKSVTGKAFDLPLFKRVLAYVQPYKVRFVFTGFLTLLLALLAPLRPWLIQYTVDHSIVRPDLDLLKDMTLLMVGLLVVEALLQFVQTYSANWVGQSVIRDLRVKIFEKVMSFKLKYFDKNAIGTLVTRCVSDIETIADIFSQGVLIIIGDLLKLIVVITVMFATNWKLTMFALIPIPFLLLATKWFKDYIKAAFQDVRTAVSKLNAFVQEHVSGVAIVQIFNREERELEAFKVINENHKQAHIRTVWANSIFFPVVEILSAISIAVLVWWGAGEVIEQASLGAEDRTTIGELIAFILYIYMLYRPIRQLADRFNVLQMGMVASERVFDVLDTEEHIQNNGVNQKPNLSGTIEFEKVWFAYERENWILKDINLTIQPGQTVAFVGATGAGKTSLINLISRFYEYQKGDIRIDGTEIREFDLDILRQKVGVVLQDVFLFGDSIYNNITLRNPEISLERVIEASKLVGAHEFISKLPGDYQFNVRERGGMLSVGQRQLIAFIRAYVYQPELLVLDEATSSVDSESEQLIQNAIDVLTKDRTSVIIAHRLSTVQKADQIVLLDKGEIKEVGTHQELLAQNGAYKQLYEIQFIES